MPHTVFKVVTFHLQESLICRPAIVGDPVDRAHSAGAMTTAGTVHKYGLVRRIIHYFQKEFCLLGGWLTPITHSNTIKLHPLRFGRCLLFTLTVTLQINNCLNAHCRQSRVVLLLGLSSAIESLIHAAKVLDANL